MEDKTKINDGDVVAIINKAQYAKSLVLLLRHEIALLRGNILLRSVVVTTLWYRANISTQPVLFPLIHGLTPRSFSSQGVVQWQTVWVLDFLGGFSGRTPRVPKPKTSSALQRCLACHAPPRQARVGTLPP